MDRHRRILDVSAEASVEEIKQAYREKVREYHPDLNDEEDAEERFKQVKEAYDVLISRASDAPDGASVEDPRRWGDPQVAKDYNTGWSLIYQDALGSHDRRWAVIGSDPGAGEEFRYINADAEHQPEPYFFETREQAEGTYSEFRFDRSQSETDEDDGVDVDLAVEEELDTLWTMYRAEKDGDRLWLVGARVEGADHFLNGSGEHQTDPHWFADREVAVGAYERYIGADPATAAADETDGTGGDDVTRTVGEPSLVIRTLDGLYDRREALRRWSVVVAAAVVGYVLGAAGSPGGGLSGPLGSLWGGVRGLDPVAAVSGTLAGLQDNLTQHDDVVLPITAFYVTVAGGYLVHRYLRSRRPPAEREFDDG